MTVQQVKVELAGVMGNLQWEATAMEQEAAVMNEKGEHWDRQRRMLAFRARKARELATRIENLLKPETKWGNS